MLTYIGSTVLIHDREPDVFGAISHPALRRMLDFLVEADRSVNALAGHFQTSRAAVPQHFRVLLDTGLVTGRRHGRQLPQRKGREYPEHPEVIHWTTTWGHAVGILHARRFWLFFAAMFVAGGGEVCLTFWCASFIQLSFESAAWAGRVGTACFAGGMSLDRDV